MELNKIATDLEILGTAIKELTIQNDIVDIEEDARRTFGMNIHEPVFEFEEESKLGQITVDFEIEIIQFKNQKCSIELSIEGGFYSTANMKEEIFKEMVAINGAAALIGIARGKIETISASIFNNGKIVIPFINVVDYYKEFSE